MRIAKKIRRGVLRTPHAVKKNRKITPGNLWCDPRWEDWEAPYADEMVTSDRTEAAKPWGARPPLWEVLLCSLLPEEQDLGAAPQLRADRTSPAPTLLELIFDNNSYVKGHGRLIDNSANLSHYNCNLQRQKDKCVWQEEWVNKGKTYMMEWEEPGSEVGKGDREVWEEGWPRGS